MARHTKELEAYYANRAEEFYAKAMRANPMPEPTPRRGVRFVRSGGGGESSEEAAAPPESLSPLLSSLRGATKAVVREASGKKTSKWNHFSDRWADARRGGDGDSNQPVALSELQDRFRALTRKALDRHHERLGKPRGGGGAQGSTADQSRAKGSDARLRAKAALARRQERAAAFSEGRELASEVRGVWDEQTSPAWGGRTNAVWGGIGYCYDLSKGNQAQPEPRWSEHMTAAATAFDDRHAQLSKDGRRLLTRSEVEQTAQLEVWLFALRSNRYSIQPLRLDTSSVSARSTSILAAQQAYHSPLAITGGYGGGDRASITGYGGGESVPGGPLMPVYERVLASETVADDPDEPEEEEPKGPWTLYSSIWGPRSEWCDGRAFYDHDEVLFERFSGDWQRALLLGVARMIGEHDADAAADDDGDGVPDEIEDVGAVLLLQNQLYTLAWQWYSDVVYSAGGFDLDVGIKQNEGWKAFTEDCGVWANLSKKDAASKNNLIFMAVDKTDRTTAASLVVADKVGDGGGDGFADDVEAATRAALATAKLEGIKSDRQLSRAEFTAALVKTSIERFVRSKQNPSNPMDDVSDAVQLLFAEHLEPAFSRPIAGRTQPKLPMPDAFRRAVCYTQAMSDALLRHSASLRVLFAALAKLTYEHSRTEGRVLPRPGKARQVRRVDPDSPFKASWVLVPGHVSLRNWAALVLSGLRLRGANLREVSLCFLYSVMAVVDGQTEQGLVKERHLPFEGFLEALVRLTACVPLPTDEQLVASEYSCAGTLLDALEQGEESRFRAFADSQECEWGGVPDPSTCGSMTARFEKLMDVLLRRIKQPVDPEATIETPLNRREVRQWAIRQLKVNGNTELPDSWAKEMAIGEAV